MALNKNIVLVDRDGTLIKKINNKKYITKKKDVKINYSLINSLKKFHNIKLICITNQSCIAKKIITRKKVNQINYYIKELLEKEKINIIKFYVSAADSNSKNFYRKPRPGFFFKAAKEFNFSLEKTFYIGDDERDIIACANAKTKCFFIGSPQIKKKWGLKKILLKGRIDKFLKKKNII